MSKFSKPPIQKTTPAATPASDRDFVAGADTPTAISHDQFPVAGGQRFGKLTLRMTQREAAVLTWCAENGTKSQHQLILDAAQKAIQEEYRRLANQPDFFL